jgi:hypothetical protein
MYDTWLEGGGFQKEAIPDMITHPATDQYGASYAFIICGRGAMNIGKTRVRGSEMFLRAIGNNDGLA